jgi:hypothetical protein
MHKRPSPDFGLTHGMPNGRKWASDDDDGLPGEYRGRGGDIGELVSKADKHGLYVTTLGGERYMVATLAGKIILRSGAFPEALAAIEGVRQ